jgi:SAM-dependent methyltransferase
MQRRYRRRIAAFLFAATGAAGLLGAATWTVGAIRRVDVVESERDQWQRPADVMRALDLGDGTVVADIGSGVGYFALKLAGRVGRQGRVLAVDVRRFPLLFLRIRALVRGRRNLAVVRGEVDDPRLPAGGVDAILVANTFHELEDPDSILDRARQALRPAGRLVVLDPSPGITDGGSPAPEGHHHESPDSAEARLHRAGFEVVSRDDSFVDVPDHGRWWLIVARKPQRD